MSFVSYIVHTHNVRGEGYACISVSLFLSDSCEELCALSALRHRSMAKRTIAVAETATKGKSSDRNASHVIPLGLAAEQEARLAKRREIMERADRRRVSLARDIPSPLSMLSEARDERDDAFGRTIEGLLESGLRL